MKEGLLEEGTPDLETIISACHALMATGSAPAMMITLEDLWLETRPQNVPGTTDEQPNWSRRGALSLEEMMRSETVAEALKAIDRLRREPVRGSTGAGIRESGRSGNSARQRSKGQQK